MRVGIAPSDVGACQHYRAEGPARTLAAAGEIEYTILPQPPAVRHAVRQHGPTPHEPVGLVEIPDVDVLLLVRGALPVRIHDVIRFLQREGIAVVIDYDDAYDRQTPALQQLNRINPRQNPYYNWAHAKQAAKLADVVTVSTPPLRRYRPDAVVLRNCIPRRYLELASRRQDDRLTVGWAGLVAGHPGDLRVCGAGVAQAVSEHGARFLNVGDGVDVKRDLNLRQPPEITGVVPLDEYAGQLTRMHVGIAPLQQNTYTEAKSSLKVLETLAAGAQSVASPAAEYVRLQAELEEWCALADVPVPGAIAGPKSKEWRRAVSAALTRAQADADTMSQIARRFVAERYLLEDRAVQWADAWEHAMTVRRGKRRRAA